jgi:hypothetical protein
VRREQARGARDDQAHLAKALTAYYAGGGAVTDWAHLRADCRRYVWAVYTAAMMFKDGAGPV